MLKQLRIPHTKLVEIVFGYGILPLEQDHTETVELHELPPTHYLQCLHYDLTASSSIEPPLH